MVETRRQRKDRHGIGEKHGKLYVTFTWRGVRCKEYVNEDDTPENRKKWEAQVGEIKARIKSGTFDYRQWFPNGTKLSVFYPGTGATAVMLTEQWLLEWHNDRSPFRPDGSLIEDAEVHPTTWLHDASVINHWLVPQLGTLPLPDLTTLRCLELKSTLKPKVSTKTVLNIMGLLHKAMGDAVEHKLIPSNPVPRLKTGRGWAKRLKKNSKPLSAEEVVLYLDAIPARVDMQDGAFITREMLWDLYHFWFHTGWRPSEIMALEFDALSVSRQVVELRKGRSPRQGGLEAAPKTGEREVVCDYDPEIFRIFDRRRRASLETGQRRYVFSDSRGRPLSQEWLAKRVWNPTLRKIEVSARGQYNIRDTFITLALSAGEDPGWVAQVCGTSEQMIFRHYRNWMPKLRRGHGRLLAQSLEIGPKTGPKTGTVTPK